MHWLGPEPTSDCRSLVYPSEELAEDDLSFYGEHFLGLALCVGALDRHRTHEGPAFKPRYLVFKGGKVEYAGDCDVVGTVQNLLCVSFITQEW